MKRSRKMFILALVLLLLLPFAAGVACDFSSSNFGSMADDTSEEALNSVGAGSNGPGLLDTLLGER